MIRARHTARIRPAAAISLSLLSLSALASCKPKAPQQAFQQQAPEVAIITVEHATVPISYQYVGMTQASKTVEIRARVSGFLLQRAFEEGKPIHAGDPLFVIDPRPFEADLEIARARVAQAQARATLAAQEVARFTEAVSKGAASQRELDKAQTEQADALASVNLSKAELAKAELDLSYTQIESPVSGVISKTLKDEGSYLDGGSNSLLATAWQTDPMYVEFAISERDWLRWREQADKGEIVGNKDNPPVEVQTMDGSVYGQQGTLVYFEPRVDPSTGTAMARASFKNPDNILKPGQFVKARITGWTRPNSIIVPQRAVIENPAGKFVFVVSPEGTSELRPVEVGDWRGDGWLILDGLSVGDRVIVDGFAKAPPGTPVRPVPLVPKVKPAPSNAKPSSSDAPPASPK